MLYDKFTNIFSCCCERPEDAQDSDLQAVRRGQPDRPPPGGQEETVRDQDQERQLVAKVQRNIPFVSIYILYNFI